MRWSLEPGTDGRGTWLIGRCEERVDVIAPPGTSIPAAERAAGSSGPTLIGWRQASWYRRDGKRLSVDSDTPDGQVGVLDTREVLERVGLRLRASVRALLERHLAELEPGGFSNSVHPELMAATWVRAELIEAFHED